MTNYTRRAVRGVGYVLVTTTCASAFSYALQVYLAKELSVSDYGLFWSVVTFMLFLLVFREIGLNSAQTKYIAEYYPQEKYAKIKTIIVSSFVFKFISSGLLILFFIVGAKYFSVHYFKSPLSYYILINLSLYVFFSFLLNHVQSILQGFQETRWYPLTEPLRLGLALVFSIILFRYDLGVMAPVFAFVLAVIVPLFIVSFGLRKYLFIWKYPLQDFWGTTKQLFQYGIPVIFTGLGSKVISYFDILVLTAVVPLAEVGVYNAILPTALLFLFFPRAITSILFPLIAELSGKKDMRRISEGMNLLYNYTFVLLIPLLITVFVFSDYFITMLFSPDYASGVLAFRILLLGVLVYVIASINDAVISALGKPAVVTKIILLSGLVNLVLNLLLIPHYHLVGAAVATSTSYLLAFILSTYWLVRHIHLASPWLVWGKLGVLAVVYCFSLFLVSSLFSLHPLLEMIMSFGLSLLPYITLLFLFKIITSQSLKKIVRRVL